MVACFALQALLADRPPFDAAAALAALQSSGEDECHRNGSPVGADPSASPFVVGFTGF
jgi:hypothetical protein